jgi:pimeloyl-ACP methyl ester carboxylesterase
MPKSSYALDIKETLAIDGSVQHLRIRGTDPANPVLLFLHGGPGVADRHWVLGHQSGLADACTLVCWDQRGAGLSYDAGRAKTEKLSIARMVDDASAVLDHLKARFSKDRIFIAGHSWGSVLGTLLVQKRPESVAAYISIGQVVHGPENERLSYEFVVNEAERRGDKKALKDLARIGAPVNGKYKSMKDMTAQRNLMTKYGGGEYKGRSSIWMSMIVPLMSSPEYGLFALPRYARGAFYCLGQLWDEVSSLDFFTAVPELKVPVYMTIGRHDKNTPAELSQKWFEALKAPHKEWVWFEESAHSPYKEEPEKWGEEVRRIIRETV